MKRRSFFKYAASLLAGLPLVGSMFRPVRQPQTAGQYTLWLYDKPVRSAHGNLEIYHFGTEHLARYRGFECFGRGVTVEDSICDLIRNIPCASTDEEFRRVLNAYSDCCHKIGDGWAARVERLVA